ncbi:glycosyltransferase family A protein [Frigidibacter sp. MR17.14]|uniref:glycosyltransferase family 2 protein n=1 Tax=Frigidibacter sp. MR17.14 TaxID=3126509 RepID=UPI003012AF43
MPRFSIVLPCFNAAATIGATLASLQAQSVSDWEAIFVDDNSTDQTLQILAEAAAFDDRLRLVANPRRGPSAARNHGALTVARGEIIAFCDADDLWSPGKLAELDRAFAKDIDAAFGRTAFFTADPDRITTTSTLPEGPLTLATLLGENPVCTMSNLSIRAGRFAATGGFDERLAQNEDLEWLIRLVGEGACVTPIHSVQTFYRASTGGLSADLGAMRRGRAAALQTAARFGAAPTPRDEAIFLRYLARRALRLDQGRFLALRLALAGLAASPAGFFSDARRGGMTVAGALAAPILPRPLRHALFT